MTRLGLAEKESVPDIVNGIGSRENLRIQISKVSDMAQMGSRFSEAVSVDHLLSLILKQTIDLTEADACIIWLKDKRGNIIPRISFGLRTPLIQSVKISVASGIVKRLMEAGNPTAISDLSKSKCIPMKRLIKNEGLQSLLAAPLGVEDDKFGVLMILTRSPRSFADTDIKIFDALAKQSALSISNIGLYDKLDRKIKEKVKDISMLFTMSKSASSCVDLNLLLNVILEKTRSLMRAKFCTLRLFTKTRHKLKLASFVGTTKTKVKSLLSFENDMAKKVMRTKSTLVINNIKTYLKERTPHCLNRGRIYSVLAVPLFSNRRKFGMLSIYIPEARFFDRENIEVIEMVGSFISMAIENTTMLERIRKDYLNSIKTLANIIDANDPYTHGHCGKVMKYSLLISRRLKLQPRDMNAVKTASLLHDIGKIGIDLNIIRKEECLTEEDWKKIRLHPEIGAKIVSQVGFLNEIVPIIRHHHARFDGGGYPDPEKRGMKIPVGSRIIAVADAFDAMTSDRPYRKAMKEKDAIEELKKCAGSQFDPDIVNAFVRSKKI